MAFNQITCSSDYGYTGLACGTENLGYIQKIIFAKDDFDFDTQTDAETQADWQTAINAQNIFPFKNFTQVEPSNEDNVTEELATGVAVFVRDGKYRETGYVNMSVHEMRQHRKFNNKSGRVFLVTSNGYIIAYSADDTKVKGFSLDTLQIGGIGTTDGSQQRRTSIYYGLADPSQINDYGVAIKPTWNPLDLEGLVLVDVDTSGTPATDELIVEVSRQADDETVTGLVATDFTVLDAAGDTQAIDTATDNGDGTYTLAPTTTFATGTVNLKTPANQTTGGYISSGTASFTI